MRVLCAACREPLFKFEPRGLTQGSPIEMGRFVPLRPEVPRPSAGKPATCPFCKRPFYATTIRGGIILTTNQGFYPRPPQGLRRETVAPRPARRTDSPDYEGT